MNNLYAKAMHVAGTYDVATPENAVVLYSVSFQPTKENRDKAFAFVKDNPEKMMIEHTDCGAKLVEMGLSGAGCGLKDEEIADIWAVASKRFISAAQGEITAFVDNADPRSVFVRMELPTLLINEKIHTVNGMDKKKFAKRFNF